MCNACFTSQPLKRHLYSCQCFFDSIFPQLALPNTENLPPSAFEAGCYLLIAAYVALSLLLPVLFVLLRASVSAIVSVPKTTVHEDGHFMFRESKIGMPYDRVVAPPSSNPIILEQLQQTQLRRPVFF